MIAVDSNILVYSHRPDSPWHAQAHAVVTGLVTAGSTWAIPWPCAYEFFSTVTHRRVYRPPSTVAQAIDQVDAWRECANLVMLHEGEGAGYWATLREVLARSRIAGGRVHDARIAALCLHHRVAELWTADRDFSAFPRLRVRNPLVGGLRN